MTETAVLAITPNPAVDRVVFLDGPLRRGEAHRAVSAREHAGGKGVNVASCLADWLGPGSGLTVSGWLGGGRDDLFGALFARKGIVDRFVRVPDPVRVNVKIVDDSETTDLNVPGPAAARADPEALEAVLSDWIDEGARAGAGRARRLAALSGSLPPGCPEDVYARLLRRLSAAGVRTLLDADGPALARALDGGAPPWAVKPNRRELAEWAGCRPDADSAMRKAALALRERGVALAVVSLGAEGAWFISDEGWISARGPVEASPPAGTVGAGDAMVAGLAAAMLEGADLATTARLATAFALGKLTQPGPDLPPRAAVTALAGAVIVERFRP